MGKRDNMHNRIVINVLLQCQYAAFILYFRLTALAAHLQGMAVL